MKKAILLLVILPYGFYLHAQFGALKGKITDNETGEAIPFATIVIEKDSVKLGGATSDFDGLFTIKPVNAGTCRVKAVYPGYADLTIKDVVIKAEETTYLDIKISEGVKLQPVEVFFYQPLIDKDNTSTGRKITREDIERLPVRSVTEIQPFSAGVVAGQIRGSRNGAGQTFIDGIKVVGSTNLPQNAVGEVNVITNGVPENDETYEKEEENRFFSVTSTPVSTFSIDVDAASYSNLRRMIRSGYMPPKDAVRIEEMINYFTYEYDQPEGDEPFTIKAETGPCAWNEKHLLLRVALQSRKLEMSELPPNNLTFLLDVSGSMSSPDKLPLLQRSLALLVEQLRPEDKVAIVVYAGAAGLVLPPTSGKEKQHILKAINRLSAGGSTAGGSGIQLAYKIAEELYKEKSNNRVILATDGDFNVGISNDNELVKMIEEKRDKGIFLTVLGFGMGNLKDARLEKLADNGNGNYAYIDDFLEAKKVLINEMSANLFTVAKDVKIQIEFNPVKIKAYRLIGYENRLLDKEDFNDDKKDAGEMGAGHSVTALYELVPEAEAGTNFDISQVDDLKYQENKMKAIALTSNEALTVKVRFKDPKENESRLREEVVEYEEKTLEEMPDDFRFVSAVAQFGMLLTSSSHLGSATYDNTIQLAKMSKGNDDEGYRSEFVGLVRSCKNMK